MGYKVNLDMGGKHQNNFSHKLYTELLVFTRPSLQNKVSQGVHPTSEERSCSIANMTPLTYSTVILISTDLRGET